MFLSTLSKTLASLTESTGGNFKPLKCTAYYHLFKLGNCLLGLWQAVILEHDVFCLRVFSILKEIPAIARYLSHCSCVGQLSQVSKLFTAAVVM